MLLKLSLVLTSLQLLVQFLVIRNILKFTSNILIQVTAFKCAVLIS